MCIRDSLRGVLVEHLEKPEDVPVKVNVVEDLDVVRICSAIEQEAHELVALRMRRTIFLAFADDSRHRRIAAVAGHEVRVGVGAVVEQQTRDLDGVPLDRRRRQPREAQIEKRLPLRMRSGRGVENERPSLATCRAFGSSLLARQLRTRGEQSSYRLEIATDDCRVNAVAGDFGMRLEQAIGGELRDRMRGPAANMVIRASVGEKARDQLGMFGGMRVGSGVVTRAAFISVSYTHLRAHETPEHL